MTMLVAGFNPLNYHKKYGVYAVYGQNSCPWLLAIKLTLFYGGFDWGKAHYQCGHSAQYSGFKLAASMFVLSILECKHHINHSEQVEHKSDLKLEGEGLNSYLGKFFF